MLTIGIDPGPRESAVVAWDGARVLYATDMANDDIGAGVVVSAMLKCEHSSSEAQVAVEWIESFGMAVGRETFETVFAIGQIASRLDCRLVPRRDVKLHLCRSVKAKDANIRQALIDRFGVVGTKKSPGPLFGITGHKWAALAIAVTAHDLERTEHEAMFHKQEVTT